MSSLENSESKDPSGIHKSPGHRIQLSLISPCYNESEVIELFYTQLRQALESLRDISHEIVFVDDGSTDDTLLKLNQIAAKEPAVRVCSLSRNFGHQTALTAGLDVAVGEAVIMMDSDLQHPPSLIPKMVEKWRQGYEIVSAVRQNTRGVSSFKSMTSKSFYFLVNILSDTAIPRGAADFCLISRRVCDMLRTMRERHRFLRGMISWMGFKRDFVPYQAPKRAAGKSKYTFLKMISLALDAIFSFSAAPLRLATRIGVIITFLGFAYFVWILARYIVLGDLIPGWASLIGVTLILGGFQLVFIGLIGQYLARIFDEVKRRPMYIFKQLPPDYRQNTSEEDLEQEKQTEF
jgi:glycosyltransferase involved in cell wall biosynthesis